jgi:hypothetical protein
MTMTVLKCECVTGRLRRRHAVIDFAQPSASDHTTPSAFYFRARLLNFMYELTLALRDQQVWRVLLYRLE